MLPYPHKASWRYITSYLFNRRLIFRSEQLLFGGIIITLLAREWNYSVDGFVLPNILYYSGWGAGLFLPLAFICSQKKIVASSAARANLNCFLILALCCLTVLLVQWLLYPEAMASYDLWTLLQFTAMPIWVLAGFLFAAQSTTSTAFLGKFAACAAWASFYSFGMRLSQADPFPFGAAGWPMRLFFLFGFCWYLSHFLLLNKTSFRMLCGLIACSLEVVFTLHKPIIFGTFFSVATLFLIFMPRLHIHKLANKILKLLLPSVLVLVVVDNIYQGVIVDKLNYFYYDRILRIDNPDEETSFRRSSSGRFDIWETAWSDFKKEPWVGTGIKNVEYEAGTISLHNGYLDLLFIFGICGCFFVFFGGYLWVKWVFRSLNCPSLLQAQSCCLAYVIGILAFNMGGMSRLFPGPSYFIMLVCGIALRVAVDNWPKIAQLPVPKNSYSQSGDNRRST
jgi:O-antigen ligase